MQSWQYMCRAPHAVETPNSPSPRQIQHSDVPSAAAAFAAALAHCGVSKWLIVRVPRQTEQTGLLLPLASLFPFPAGIVALSTGPRVAHSYSMIGSVAAVAAASSSRLRRLS